MAVKSRTQQTGRRIGPNIVRAWFDTVINPLLHGLASEQRLLAKRNWTWRFKQQRLLSIIPIESLITFEALDNLDQFLALGPAPAKECRREVTRHNEQLKNLTEACRALHQSVRSSPQLLATYEKARRDHALPRQPGQDFNSFFGAYPPALHLDVLTEDIVNGAGLLPNYYSTAPVWNKYRDEFIKAREIREARPHWEATCKAGTDLAGTVDQFINSLKLIRQDLSLEYDLPLAQASPA